MNGGDDSLVGGLISAITFITVNHVVGIATFRSKRIEAFVEGRPFRSLSTTGACSRTCWRERSSRTTNSTPRCGRMAARAWTTFAAPFSRTTAPSRSPRAAVLATDHDDPALPRASAGVMVEIAAPFACTLGGQRNDAQAVRVRMNITDVRGLFRGLADAIYLNTATIHAVAGYCMFRTIFLFLLWRPTCCGA